MIKKPVFENDLIIGMQRELQPFQRKEAMANLDKAGGYLTSALDILEEAGLTAQADAVLAILSKIAEDENEAKRKSHREGEPKHKHPKDPGKIHDPHIPKTTEQAVQGLKDYGIPFVNLSDDGNVDHHDPKKVQLKDSEKAKELLDQDVGNADLEVTDEPLLHDFEEERH